ncbi:hypothetical protein J2S08_002078 [Bacillus chungangensis]|uniref:Uncharacterized protein n=1 Tax=Bacillus chungangensis TaxID=587633 RepID=A0ABT9WSH5_9BACI|nr:hypothetical protein [Bacillus chungangensis]
MDVMVFLTSEYRVKKLPCYQKLWMYPIAYILKYIAIGVTFMADKFDERVTYEILTKTTYEGKVRSHIKLLTKLR